MAGPPSAQRVPRCIKWPAWGGCTGRYGAQQQRTSQLRLTLLVCKHDAQRAVAVHHNSLCAEVMRDGGEPVLGCDVVALDIELPLQAPTAGAVCVAGGGDTRVIARLHMCSAVRVCARRQTHMAAATTGRGMRETCTGELQTCDVLCCGLGTSG